MMILGSPFEKGGAFDVMRALDGPEEWKSRFSLPALPRPGLCCTISILYLENHYDVDSRVLFEHMKPYAHTT
jgi:hypothetical protein